MKIDGKALAEDILTKLAREVAGLKANGVTPTLAVILVGDNPASLAYIRQKQKATIIIGANLLLNQQPTTINKQQLGNIIETYNQDKRVHGVIVQRPLPEAMGNTKEILNMVNPNKDVDGFLPNSPFDVPVAAAVREILKTVYSSVIPAPEPESIKATNWIPDQVRDDNFIEWLRTKNIIIIGRGETAGAPIARYLEKQGCATSVLHSQTRNAPEIMKNADIIISCVGKEHVVTEESVKPGAILIGVGIFRDQAGKLRGDYNEEEIAEVASYYTPTPGGVGPVNVACLMQNLIKACMMMTTRRES